MEKIKKSFFWVTISFIVVLIHLTLYSNEHYGLFFWPYVMKFFVPIIFMAFVFYHFDKVRKEQKNESLFDAIIKLKLRSFSYWMMVFVVWLFGFSFVNSSYNLLLSESEISKKLVIDHNPYWGQGLIMLISLILLIICLRRFYKIIRK